MTIFGAYDIEAMNEADVREVIVRPLLHLLGYRQGTSANIITEKALHYDRVFLGRKNEKTDPVLRGRADYICEVVPFGRWVVEAKSPRQDLTLEDAQQAHTYAAHPEIAATLFLITNGREFRLYRTSRPDEPIYSWKTEQTELKRMNILNLLDPEAIRRRVHIPVDFGKPVTKGFGSRVVVIGGWVVADSFDADWPLLASEMKKFAGMRGTIIGNKVERVQDGLIEVELDVAGAFSLFDVLNKAAGLTLFRFFTADEYVSQDIEVPSIFQGSFDAKLKAGTIIPPLPGSPIGKPATPLPYDVIWTARVEAVGYVEGDRFRGTYSTSTLFRHDRIPPHMTNVIPKMANSSHQGRFEIIIR